MTLEVFQALLLINRYCLEQDSCKTCPIKELCGKRPCEW